MPQNPYRVEAPDGKVIEFPASMTQADIEEAMRKLYGKEGPMGRFLTGAAEASVLPMTEAALHPIETARSLAGTAQAIGNPILTAQTIGREGYSAIPVVGPIAQQVAEKIRAGDIAGALGYGAGLVGPGLLMAGAARLGGPGMLNRIAEGQYARVISPTRGLSSRAAKIAARKVTPELVERGVIAPTRQGLLERFITEAEVASKRLTDALDALPGDAKVNVNPVYKTLEDFKKEHALIKGTDQVANEVIYKRVNWAQEKLLNMADDFGNASRESVRSFRKLMDDYLTDSQGMYNPEVRQVAEVRATKATADALRDVLAKDNPNIADLNKEFNFWQKSRQLLDATQLRTFGQETPLTQTIFGAAGGAAGLAHGGLIEAIPTAAAAAIAVKVFRSTGYRTLSAVAKGKLADMLARGDLTGATGLLTLMSNQLDREAKQKWHRPGIIEEEKTP